MQPLKVKNVASAIDVLKPCIVTYTLNSTYIKCELGDFYFTNKGDKLKAREMSFVKMFRNHYVKTECVDYDKRFVKHKPNFIKFYKTKGEYDDLVEIDINRAYPTAGKILKIIPDDLFDKGLQHSKGAFLVAIGSLYRKRRIIQVDKNGNRKLISEEKRDPKLSELWNSIVSYTDYAIEKTASLRYNAVYFYWCDALFVKKEYAGLFVNGLNSFGFETKTKEISKLSFTDEKAKVYYKNGDKPKEYGLPYRKHSVNSIETLKKRYERK